MGVQWDDSKFKKSVVTKGLDGIQEWCMVEWEPTSKENCPVDTGVMRASLGVERSDSEKCCFVGGGGGSSDYILKQELDRSLHHNVGGPGFIMNTVKEKSPLLAQYVNKHVNE
jgi:hypothetical protein